MAESLNDKQIESLVSQARGVATIKNNKYEVLSIIWKVPLSEEAQDARRNAAENEAFIQGMMVARGQLRADEVIFSGINAGFRIEQANLVLTANQESPKNVGGQGKSFPIDSRFRHILVLEEGEPGTY